MAKKASNPNPPAGKRPPPPPPPGPPSRKFVGGFFGEFESRSSIKERKNYEVYMRGWEDGQKALKGE